MRSHFDARSRGKDRNRNPRLGVGLRPKLRIGCFRPDEFDTGHFRVAFREVGRSGTFADITKGKDYGVVEVGTLCVGDL